jgi:hypothetical protein
MASKLHSFKASEFLEQVVPTFYHAVKVGEVKLPCPEVPIKTTWTAAYLSPNQLCRRHIIHPTHAAVAAKMSAIPALVIKTKQREKRAVNATRMPRRFFTLSTA